LTTGFAGYEPSTGATRATAISFIIGAHAVLAGAVLSLGGLQVMRETPPLLVQLIDAPRLRPLDAPRPVPLPNMRPPEIHISIPPPPENLYAIRVEEKLPPAPPSPAPAVAAAEPAPVLAPTLEPPRADMAYLNNPAPSYPAVSKRAGEQGRVMLRVRVDTQGQVENIMVHATSGFPRLDEAALAAVRRWRFVPARLGERAVAGWALVPVTFALHG
jgi:protein TonB